jgi:hypothetical protein
MPGEFRRAFEQLRADGATNAVDIRRAAHTLKWHAERLDKIERELADRHAPTAPYPPPQTAAHGLDLSQYGQITQSIILKTIEDREAKKAVELVGSFRGFGWSLTKTIITVGVLAVVGVLATVMILEAARELGHHGEATPHEFHGEHEAH